MLLKSVKNLLWAGTEELFWWGGSGGSARHQCCCCFPHLDTSCSSWTFPPTTDPPRTVNFFFSLVEGFRSSCLFWVCSTGDLEVAGDYFLLPLPCFPSQVVGSRQQDGWKPHLCPLLVWSRHSAWWEGKTDTVQLKKALEMISISSQHDNMCTKEEMWLKIATSSNTELSNKWTQLSCDCWDSFTGTVAAI